MSASVVSEPIETVQFGENGAGYFCRVADKAAKDDDYEFKSHGAIQSNDLFVIFSLMSKADKQEILDKALYVVSNIAQMQYVSSY